MFEAFFWAKIIIAVSIVMLLSYIAERVGPRIAGILAGYPLGTAIALFFYGLEISPQFAARSAIYTMIGLVATHCFIYFYYKASLRFRRGGLLFASLCAVCGYFIVAWCLRFIQFQTPLVIVIPLISTGVFILRFKKIKNEQIENKIELSYKNLLFRALFAAGIIVLITSTARIVGTKWAGLFAAFPITTFPLLLIVHYTYGPKYVHTIIRNIPIGLVALIIYAFFISLTYATTGIYAGTAISFFMATIYLVLYMFVAGIIRSKKPN